MKEGAQRVGSTFRLSTAAVGSRDSCAVFVRSRMKTDALALFCRRDDERVVGLETWRRTRWDVTEQLCEAESAAGNFRSVPVCRQPVRNRVSIRL